MCVCVCERTSYEVLYRVLNNTGKGCDVKVVNIRPGCDCSSQQLFEALEQG